MDLLLVFLFASSALQPCSFAIVHAAPTSLAAEGSDEILSRLRVVNQPDSPIVVTSIDFHDSKLDHSLGSYSWAPQTYSMELLNRSDRTISHVEATVRVRWPDGSGGGRGQTCRDSIEPGQRVMLTVRGGAGRGTNPRFDQVTVDISVGSMMIGDCKFTPSQAVRNQP